MLMTGPVQMLGGLGTGLLPSKFSMKCAHYKCQILSCVSVVKRRLQRTFLGFERKRANSTLSLDQKSSPSITLKTSLYCLPLACIKYPPPTTMTEPSCVLSHLCSGNTASAFRIYK